MPSRGVGRMPRFGLLYGAYFTSLVGSWAFRIGVIVGLLRHDAGALGLGVAVIFGPLIIGSLLLAPLADRLDRLAIMITLDVVRAAAMIPLLFIPSVESPATYLMIAVLSITQPMFNAAQVAFVRATSAPARLVTVLRNLSVIEWLTYVVGMASGAALMARFSLSTVIATNGVSYVASAALLGVLRASAGGAVPEAARQAPGGTLADLRPLAAGFAIILLLNLGAGIINVYPAVEVAAERGGSESALATMIVVNGIFGLVGTLCVKSVYTRIGALRAMTLASGLIAACLALMAADGGFPLAVLASSLMLGIGQIFAVSAQTHMVASVPQGRAGKLAGLFQFCTFGGITLNGLLFAMMSHWLGFGAIVAGCAACALAAFVIGLAGCRRARCPAGPMASHAVAVEGVRP